MATRTKLRAHREVVPLGEPVIEDGVNYPDKANNHQLQAELAETKLAKRKEAARRKKAEAERLQKEEVLTAKDQRIKAARAKLQAAGLDPKEFDL